jgi:hypothetical protein
LGVGAAGGNGTDYNSSRPQLFHGTISQAVSVSAAFASPRTGYDDL